MSRDWMIVFGCSTWMDVSRDWNITSAVYFYLCMFTRYVAPFINSLATLVHSLHSSTHFRNFTRSRFASQVLRWGEAPFGL